MIRGLVCLLVGHRDRYVVAWLTRCDRCGRHRSNWWVHP